MSYLNVSDDAAGAILQLAAQLEEEYKTLLDCNLLLKLQFNENEEGLGRHAKSISDLIEDLYQKVKINREAKKAALKLKQIAAIIDDHINGPFPVSGAAVAPPSETQSYIAGVMTRIYSDGFRGMRTPASNGQWQGNTFIPDKNAIPAVFNPHKRTFGQIIENFEKKFHIPFTGIPFTEDGIADFSGIAIAQVPAEDIVEAYYPGLVDMEAINYQKVFENRSANFQLADEYAAAKQLPIPGLESYTAEDLKKWRENNLFTWEESPLYGYLLVPAEIHDNITHSGLVAIETRIDNAVKNITSRGGAAE